jgi:hypothetical protein
MQLKAEGRKTTLMVTEQGAFLDGYDDAGAREQGTSHLLDALGASLKPSTPQSSRTVAGERPPGSSSLRQALVQTFLKQ